MSLLKMDGKSEFLTVIQEGRLQEKVCGLLILPRFPQRFKGGQ